MNASFSPKSTFGAEAKNCAVSFTSQQESENGAALTNADFLRRSCEEAHLGIGPRDHHDCPHQVTFDQFSASDLETCEVAIQAAYRHVFGNCYVMENERLFELEAQLKDGRLCIREFVRGLAKSDFYASRFFASVAPQRGVELGFKHLLGRPPESQAEVSDCIALQASAGFSALVDHWIDSAEYSEVFGNDTVPYIRSWNSAAGISMASFPRIAALEQNFVNSDLAKGSSSILLRNLALGVPLKIKRPHGVRGMQVSAAWADGKPPARAEKLWRGLALVGAAHLGGMLVNVTSQIFGIHALDRIPAMFLGL